MSSSTYPKDWWCLRCKSRMVIVSALSALICSTCVDEVTAAHDAARTQPAEEQPE